VYKKRVDFSRFSSIKVGSEVDVFVVERGDSVEEGGFIVGGANNLLVSSTPPKLFMLSKDFAYIKEQNSLLEVGARTMSGQLLSFAKRESIAGLEFIAKLPGTIGGMVAMNAGVKKYEIFNLIEEVKINGKWHSKESIEYGYRFAKIDGLIEAVRLKRESGYSRDLEQKLIKLRSNQPKEPSAGSAFKNPEGDFAGRLIEAVGLKGKRVGDMAFSKIHSNFLVNLGRGSFNDAVFLLEEAKRRVFEEFGIKLEEEIKILNSPK
jgi:UDP-N-acetylmuramate dehydrogenase